MVLVQCYLVLWPRQPGALPVEPPRGGGALVLLHFLCCRVPGRIPSISCPAMHQPPLQHPTCCPEGQRQDPSGHGFAGSLRPYQLTEPGSLSVHACTCACPNSCVRVPRNAALGLFPSSRELDGFTWTCPSPTHTCGPSLFPPTPTPAVLLALLMTFRIPSFLF